MEAPAPDPFLAEGAPHLLPVTVSYNNFSLDTVVNLLKGFTHIIDTEDAVVESTSFDTFQTEC